MSNNLPHVVIVGSGFGGLQAARMLARAPVQITVIDRHNYHTFSPLLHQVATAELEPEQVAYPIRNLLRHSPNAQFQMAEVMAIDLDAQVLQTSQTAIAYDYLILATGSTPALNRVPGATTYAFPLKTLPQAIALRNQILHCLEQAVYETDLARREALLTFAIIGGGATGVELASSLAALMQTVIPCDFPQLDLRQVRIVLLHGGDRLLPNFPAALSIHTQRHLQRSGVEVYLQERVVEITADAVLLSGERRISTFTAIWTAGVQGAAMSQWDLPAAPSGKVAVLPTLAIPHYPNVYVIGDGAEVPGQVLPMLASVAVAQSQHAVGNLLRTLRGVKPQPFRYRHPGDMVILSRFAAVAQIGGISLTGFAAWAVWLAFHLAVLPGIRNRLNTLFNWLWNYGLQDRMHRLILAAAARPGSSRNERLPLGQRS